MSESVTDDAVSRSRPNSPPSRAPADQGSGSREQGNEGAGIGELGSLSPSTPTSSTSTRTPATVDGSIRPIEDTRPLRSVEAIRADLEHPHTAALTALHSTTIGDGPIGRLLRDVEPLLDALEVAESVISNLGLVASELTNGHRRECYAKFDTEVERDAALARIAAVEALPAAGASVRRKSLDETVNGVDPMSFEYGWLRAIEHVRAALAASPTPTGPETKPKRCAGTLGDRPSWMSPGQFSPCRCELLDGHGGECQCEHTRPATPTEPTEETQ